MGKYMLISVYDREILTEQFNTKQAAQAAMHREMQEQGKVHADIFDVSMYDDGSCGFGEYSAYSNDGVNHADCDWLIVAL